MKNTDINPIKVYYDPPPIPGWRKVAYHAYHDDYTELGCGHGATEKEAILDLEELLVLHDMEA